MRRGERLYLDTNVYNALADRLTPSQVRRLRPALASADLAEPLLSPVVILEVVQTPDELRRERLVYVIHHLCAENLLVEPEELILDFIVREMKRGDLQHLALSTIYCRTDLARVWADVRADWRKPFVVDDRVREGLKLAKVLYGMLHALLGRKNALSGPYSGPVLVGVDGVEEAQELLRAATAEVRKRPRSADHDEVLLHHVWTLAVALVGSRSSLFYELLDPLWAALGISGTEKKVEYLFAEMKFLFASGPVLTMAAWLTSQATRKYSQGNLFDGYNLMYTPYIHSFLTLDESVLRFVEPYKSHPTMGKVQNASTFIEAVVKAVGEGETHGP